MPQSILKNRWYAVHLRYARSVGAGCGWTLLGTIAGQAGTLLTVIMAARLLGRETFGVYGAVQITAVTLANVASAGLGISATNYLAQTATVAPERAGRIAGLISMVTLFSAILLSVGLAVCAPQLSTLLLGDSGFVIPLRAASVYVFFATLNGYQIGALIGMQAYRAVAWAGLAQAIVLPIAMFRLTTTHGLVGAVVAFDLAAIVVWAIQHRLLRAQFHSFGIRVAYSGLLAERRVFSSFALPAACAGICGNLAIWASTALLLRSPDGTTQLALFAAVNSLRGLVLVVPGIVNKVAVPVFAQLHAGSTPRFRETFWSNVQLNALFAIMVAGGMMICGETILGLFGKKFSASGMFALVMFAACFEVVAVALYQALLCRGAIWTHFGGMVLWSGLLVGVAGALGGRMGGQALALGYLISWFTCAALYMLLAVRFLSDVHPRNARDGMSTFRDAAART
jgi:O-antigen/teichoic acid export membrane protein